MLMALTHLIIIAAVISKCVAGHPSTPCRLLRSPARTVTAGAKLPTLMTRCGRSSQGGSCAAPAEPPRRRVSATGGEVGPDDATPEAAARAATSDSQGSSSWGEPLPSGVLRPCRLTGAIPRLTQPVLVLVLCSISSMRGRDTARLTALSSCGMLLVWPLLMADCKRGRRLLNLCRRYTLAAVQGSAGKLAPASPRVRCTI